MALLYSSPQCPCPVLWQGLVHQLFLFMEGGHVDGFAMGWTTNMFALTTYVAKQESPRISFIDYVLKSMKP